MGRAPRGPALCGALCDRRKATLRVVEGQFPVYLPSIDTWRGEPAMADTSTCPACGAWADGTVAACPRCGQAMQLKKGSTVRGWLLVVIGLFLILMMGGITLAVGPTLLDPPKDPDSTLTRQQGLIFFGLFLLVILFGLMSLAYGIFQITTRRESGKFIAVTLIMAAALFGLCFYIIGTMK